MKLQAIKDLSAVLVHNYYQNNSNVTGYSGSIISEILVQLREAGQEKDLQLIATSGKLIIRNDSEASLFLHEFKQSELPDGADQDAVKQFIELILRDYVYKV
jgi:maltodextrin utilization protein YvdJ